MPWRCHRCQSTASVRTCAGVASELKGWAASVRMLLSATACLRPRHHDLGSWGVGDSCWSFRAVQRVLRKTAHRASLFACREPFAISDGFGPLNSMLSVAHTHTRRQQHLSAALIRGPANSDIVVPDESPLESSVLYLRFFFKKKLAALVSSVPGAGALCVCVCGGGRGSIRREFSLRMSALRSFTHPN